MVVLTIFSTLARIRSTTRIHSNQLASSTTGKRRNKPAGPPLLLDAAAARRQHVRAMAMKYIPHTQARPVHGLLLLLPAGCFGCNIQDLLDDFNKKQAPPTEVQPVEVETKEKKEAPQEEEAEVEAADEAAPISDEEAAAEAEAEEDRRPAGSKTAVSTKEKKKKKEPEAAGKKGRSKKSGLPGKKIEGVFGILAAEESSRGVHDLFTSGDVQSEEQKKKQDEEIWKCVARESKKAGFKGKYCDPKCHKCVKIHLLSLLQRP
jgi:hypothetical protein